MKPHWRPVPRADFRKLHDARLQAHYAVQWLARAARAFLPPQAGDAHTHLSWDGGFGGLTTQPLPDGARLGLRIADLTLALLGDGADELALDGRAEVEVRRWLGDALRRAGSNLPRWTRRSLMRCPVTSSPSERVIRWTSFPIPSKRSRPGSPTPMTRSGLCSDKLAARKLKAPPVRAWPHHFDLDCSR